MSQGVAAAAVLRRRDIGAVRTQISRLRAAMHETGSDKRQRLFGSLFFSSPAVATAPGGRKNVDVENPCFEDFTFPLSVVENWAMGTLTYGDNDHEK